MLPGVRKISEMNILVLAVNYPSTTSMPGSPRLFNICRQLSKEHRMFLCTLYPTAANRERFRADPVTAGVFQQIFEMPASKPDTESLQKWTRAKLHTLALEPHFSLRYRKPEHLLLVREELNRIVQETSAGLIHLDGVGMSQFVTQVPGLPVVMDFCDCVSELYRQQAEGETEPRRKLSLLLERRSFQRAERKILKSCTLALSISQADEDALRKLAPSANFLLLSNGVDSDYFSFSPQPDSPKRLVFTGVMGYAPNDDAARYFIDAIFPLVRERHPDALFSVVGSEPSAALLECARVPGVSIHGDVPDIRPYVEESQIFVSPLRFGMGVKNKILSAMSMGRPVVATTLSANGISIENERHFLAADEPAAFAASIDRLLTDEELRRRLVRDARQLIESEYAWTARVQPLLGRIAELEKP